MKKALALLSAGLLTLSLAACSSAAPSAAPVSSAAASAPAGSTSAAPAAADGENYKVYLITMDQMDQHWVNVDKGAKAAADELGNVEYKWSAPDVKDDAKQIELINNAVADGANAILLAANGPDAVTSALEEAQAAGVTIVYVDSPANLPAAATFSTDNVAAGKTAGDEMIAALEAAGTTTGKIGVVSVNAATQSTVDRETGFRSAFEGTEFELLETQYGEGDAVKSKDIADTYITDGVVGIFGANEGSTVGVGNAIQEAGEAIIGVGFDKSDMIKQLIESDVLLATMAQNPDVMGGEGLKAAVGVLDGSMEAAGEVIDTGVTVLTKENIATA